MEVRLNKIFILLLVIGALLGSRPGYSQYRDGPPEVTQEEQIDTAEIDFENQNIGFVSTFVRTPFVIFVCLGTFCGAFFSIVTEFLVNIFQGFDNGYPNTNLIWELGWNKIMKPETPVGLIFL
ncbi:hypothetical protein [Cyclobacterium marinum]|uniref:Uncharacterized protein n=1 Tax=Cyclobacterium marinum (strain ATCC 25205 / DSM 745 / LMG 13164 / NCIMB 1802) TaxID=880070 RepID=G0IZC2_CYCMS|nr:hypothetical protein [Cyclobacterium marinum]AEL24395.1 hypothetical protein Cycma_0620 [Cyclobacterium marinum DSM 745]